MADQVIVENGRVSNLFKTINAIAVILISALLIWIAATVNHMSTQVAVLVSQNQDIRNDFIRLDRERKAEDAKLERRIAELERQR